MPHHRHPVTSQDEPLNITEVECGLRPRSRMTISPRRRIAASSEHIAEQPSAFFCLGGVLFVISVHCAFPIWPSFPIRSVASAHPRLIVTCYQRSGRGYPEPTGLDMPHRTRWERGLL